MTEFELGSYRIRLATEFGPRIVGLSHEGGPQIFAVLDDDVAIDHPGGTYRFHGGHRLWAAPENAGTTYATDDHPCQVRRADGAVVVSGPVDAAGLTKEISIRSRGSALEVSHRISRQAGHGSLAAWAITQLPLGGIALLAVAGEETSPLPNRQLVLWPYTRITDPRLTIEEHVIVVEAEGDAPLKIGTGPGTVGRLGYLRSNQLFLKECIAASGDTIPDLGAARQVYVGQGFCELETMGGLSDAEATITENWSVVPCQGTAHAIQLTTAGVGT